MATKEQCRNRTSNNRFKIKVSRNGPYIISGGIPLNAFGSIKEIDLLVVRDKVICAAFEVATTVSTANKAINDRYRNLFAALPSWNIKAGVVVKSQDYETARAQLLSVANEKQHLSQKVKILKVSQLTREAVEAILSEISYFQ